MIRRDRGRVGVPGNRQERGRNEDGPKGQGVQPSDGRNKNTGVGSLLEPGVGSDMNQGAGQRTEVGCHWSGSESGEEAEEGHSEAEDGNGWENVGVKSDTEGTASHMEDRQAEEAGDKRKVGSDGGSEETRETEG